MTKLNFNFSSESISNSFYERNDQKNILLFPFLFDAWKNLRCKIYNSYEKNILEFELDKAISLDEFKKKLEKPLPEIFDSDEIIIKTVDGHFKFESTKSFLNSKISNNQINLIKTNDNPSDNFIIEFRGYGSERFNAVMNENSIKEFYKNNSIVNFLTEKTHINIEYFSNKFSIDVENIEHIISKKKNYQSKKIHDSNFYIDLKFWNNFDVKDNQKKIIFISNNFKIDISNNFHFNELEKKINNIFNSQIPQSDRFISYLIIFKSNLVNLDEKFRLVNNNEFISNIKSIKNNIKNYISTINKRLLIGSADTFSLQLQAQKLDLRKSKLRLSKKVFLNGELIFRVPENEQETVLIFIKLASLKMIPLTSVNVLEYSTSEGIDAIADVKLDESSPIEKDCLIEFEPTFGQFKTHRHPPKHVDYIICWEIEEYWKKSLDKKNDWLYSFNLESYPKEVKVVEISKFKNLDIKD